jgi:hypothetical protein
MLDLGRQMGSARTRRSYEVERKDGKRMLATVGSDDESASIICRVSAGNCAEATTAEQL